MRQIHETAEEAIFDSVRHNGAAFCYDTPDNREYLEEKCGDYVENDAEIEYWSTAEDDGSEWQIFITTEKA